MIVLTENPVTLNGEKLDYDMKYLSANGDSREAKRQKRKNTWQQFKDSGVGQAILDFGKSKLDSSGGGVYPQEPISYEPPLPPISTTPVKEGWWSRQSGGVKAAIVLTAVAGLSVGGYYLYKRNK